jgi:hypothetical protein
MRAAMRRYWLTTHWPLASRDHSVHHSGVYLQEGAEKVARDMRPGDRVLIDVTPIIVSRNAVNKS